ncbi:MAG: hypothetical protein ABL308_05970 [Oceanicaulis sp.]
MLRAALLWLGSAWLDHAAGTLRAIGLALFLAAILADEGVSIELLGVGAIVLLVSPFVARTAASVERSEDHD